MGCTYWIFAVSLTLQAVNSAVLLWGPKQIQFPALKQFSNEDLKQLLNSIDNPQIIAFRSKSANAADSINKLLTNKTTAYIPNTRISIDNAQELTGDQAADFGIVEDILKQSRHTKGFNAVVALIIKDAERVKRKTEFTSPAVESPEAAYLEPLNVPILYSAVSPTDKNLEAMIYSSRPPTIKTNTSTINLGAATLTKMDIRDSYTRLIATIPVENGKVYLRFKFPWLNGYWYLTSVEVEFVGAHARQFNLTLNQSVTAPRHFSYHCGGEIVFTDPENDIELHLFEVQAQPDAHKHRFNDAYNCVPFTTGPIWSGLFVTSVLVLGLAVGLAALSSIKTMDKFDSHKTKQLSITVWE